MFWFWRQEASLARLWIPDERRPKMLSSQDRTGGEPGVTENPINRLPFQHQGLPIGPSLRESNGDVIRNLEEKAEEVPGESLPAAIIRRMS